MKICVVFGHHNTTNSFNAAIRDTFIDESKMWPYYRFDKFI